MKEKALIYMGVTLFFFFFASIYAICMTKAEEKKNIGVFCLYMQQFLLRGLFLVLHHVQYRKKHCNLNL